MCQPSCERILDLLGCLKIVVLLLLSLDHFVYICHCRFWLNMIMKIGRLESGSKYMMEAGSYFWWNRQWCGVKDQIHQIQEDHSCGQLWWECKAICEFCLKCLVKSLYSYMKFLVLVLIHCTQNLTCRPGRFFYYRSSGVHSSIGQSHFFVFLCETQTLTILLSVQECK